MRPRAADAFSLDVCKVAIVVMKRFCIAPRSARPPLICDNAESSTLSALVAPACVDKSTAASDEKLPLLVPAVANTWALPVATDSAPLVLVNATVPVLMAAMVPPSVSVVPPKLTVSVAVEVPPVTENAPMPILRPSVVVSVIEF